MRLRIDWDIQCNKQDHAEIFSLSKWFKKVCNQESFLFPQKRSLTKKCTKGTARGEHVEQAILTEKAVISSIHFQEGLFADSSSGFTRTISFHSIIYQTCQAVWLSSSYDLCLFSSKRGQITTPKKKAFRDWLRQLMQLTILWKIFARPKKITDSAAHGGTCPAGADWKKRLKSWLSIFGKVCLQTGVLASQKQFKFILPCRIKKRRSSLSSGKDQKLPFFR